MGLFISRLIDGTITPLNETVLPPNPSVEERAVPPFGQPPFNDEPRTANNIGAPLPDMDNRSPLMDNTTPPPLIQLPPPPPPTLIHSPSPPNYPPPQIHYPAQSLPSPTHTPDVNIKMKAVEIQKFDGQHHKWKKWKKLTMAAFGSCEWDRVLSDGAFATAHKKMNSLVYLQLQVAVADGGAAHLVDQYESVRDGHASWQNLVIWYDGDTMRQETGIELRQKQLRLRLLPGRSADDYIALCRMN
ncbi:MAG: hypothetical protein ACREOZ_02320 [Gloeomargaritales cyanobacterium]